MELNRNREVSIRAWYNESELVDESENWEVFSKEEEDIMYIFVKNPKTNNQLKLRIIKSCEIKDSETKEIDKKEGES
jgi:hypothetical protein